MSAAHELYQEDHAIFDLVYAFYLDNQAITLYDEWLAPVLDFFRATVGLPHVFHLIYNTPNRTDRHFVELAGKAECDFLLDEYETGKIKRDEMVIVRNILGNTKHAEFNYFYADLNRRTHNDFIVADIDFNYQEHWKSYHLKNQQMLEDRSLFLKEVDEIFTILELDTVVKKDFHDNYQDYKLYKYQQSIALGKLRLDADKVPRSRADMISKLSDEENWKYYKISEISRLLSRRKQEPALVVQTSLLNDAEAWIKEKILELNYLHSISDNSQGTATVDRQVEFNNDLYLKLEPDLNDDLLLKMIPSDYRGGIQHRDLGLSGVIISKVKDQAALKSAVLAYLKMDLAMYVQKTLFAICEKLDYTECMEPLYQFITTDARLAGSDRNFLTDLYIGLGGDITDFSAFVSPVPQKEELDYLSWNWYLIEKLLDAEPEAMAALLRPVLLDALQPESHQVLAAEYLIRLNDYQGLVYWSDFIVARGRTPFENRHDFVKAKIHLIEHLDLIPLLFRTMEPFIVTDAQTPERPRNLISEFIADLLLLLVSRSPGLFAQIDPVMEALITKYPEPKPVYWLKRYRREITQEYHNQCMPELSIEEIAREFENAINTATIKQN